MLSKEAIEEFKKIYKEEFGEDLSDIEATEKGTHVLNFFRVIYKPIPKDSKLKEAKDTTLREIIK